MTAMINKTKDKAENRRQKTEINFNFLLSQFQI